MMPTYMEISYQEILGYPNQRMKSQGAHLDSAGAPTLKANMAGTTKGPWASLYNYLTRPRSLTVGSTNVQTGPELREHR